MLSVKWEPHCTKVSLHKMFLNAPQDIHEALGEYLNKGKKRLPSSIKAFIGKNLSQVDHSHVLDSSHLETQGNHFDLMPIFDKINETYFERSLLLKITWFGNPLPRSKSRLSLGLYYDSLKLVKIHRVLDDPIVPMYVLEYIVYHEMLHSVCRVYVDEKGINRVHSREYKNREKFFLQYDEANKWLKQHQKKFFALKGT
jgi:hypothetical protein